MNETKEKKIIKRIEELQEELEVLKLAIAPRRSTNCKEDKGSQRFQRTELRIGDKVQVKNAIRLGQEREGKVIAVNHKTNRVTVKGKNNKGTLSRLEKNLKRIGNYSEE